MAAPSACQFFANNIAGMARVAETMREAAMVDRVPERDAKTGRIVRVKAVPPEARH